MSDAHDHLHEILRKYLPRTLAETSVDRALGQCDLSRYSLERQDLPAVISKLEMPIRLFVNEADQPRIRAELAALMGREAQRALSIRIAEEPDISRARLLMRRVCSDLQIGSVTAQKCITIVSELARNIVSYTEGGSIEIEVARETRRVHVHARDKGPGIKNVDEIMSGAYRSKTGLGKGILGVKRLAERFDLETGRSGTHVRVEVAW